MPRMLIEKANKYYTKFKITPSQKLQKHLEDWSKRISIKVTDFKQGPDYEVNFKVEGKSKKVIYFFRGKCYLA